MKQCIFIYNTLLEKVWILVLKILPLIISDNKAALRKKIGNRYSLPTKHARTLSASLKRIHQWNLFWSLGLLPPSSSFYYSPVPSLINPETVHYLLAGEKKIIKFPANITVGGIHSSIYRRGKKKWPKLWHILCLSLRRLTAGDFNPGDG